jgi:hypothetical protein
MRAVHHAFPHQPSGAHRRYHGDAEAASARLRGVRALRGRHRHRLHGQEGLRRGLPVRGSAQLCEGFLKDTFCYGIRISVMLVVFTERVCRQTRASSHLRISVQ